MKKQIIIIGAGIAGLSAGCNLQRNGYETQIYELSKRAGGLCTAWKRKGYIMENCIHFLTGAVPFDSFYTSWQSVINPEDLDLIYTPEYLTVEKKDGKSITLYADLAKLEKEMLEKAPEDAHLIKEFIAAAWKFTKFKIPVDPPSEISGFFDKIKVILKILPFLRNFKKWNSITINEYVEQYKNPLLKDALKNSLQPERAALSLLFIFAMMHIKSLSYPLGGALKLVELIENNYLQSGGKINYSSKVKKIIVENGKATGILLENGKSYRGDIVISAADGHYTIFNMLGGKYLNSKIKNLYSNFKVMPSYVQVYLGIARTFKGEPTTLALQLKNGLKIDETTKLDYITYRIHNIDPTLSPPGGTLVTAMLKTANYTYWVDLKKNNREEYRSEKKRIAREVIACLNLKYKDITSKVDVMDVSTPATVIRYTNNWQGSHEGWITTPEMGFMKIQRTLPGLDNFYMAGQWVESMGGLPTSVVSGKHVAHIICHKDGKKFCVA